MPTHDWSKTAAALTEALKPLRAGAPESMAAFSTLARAALHPSALEVKTKELIALAISVATRCDGCIAFHAEAASRHGATRDEVMETMGMAIYMGAGPSVMYAAQALEAFDQFAERKAGAQDCARVVAGRRHVRRAPRTGPHPRPSSPSQEDIAALEASAAAADEAAIG